MNPRIPVRKIPRAGRTGWSDLGLRAFKLKAAKLYFVTLLLWIYAGRMWPASFTFPTLDLYTSIFYAFCLEITMLYSIRAITVIFLLIVHKIHPAISLQIFSLCSIVSSRMCLKITNYKNSHKNFLPQLEVALLQKFIIDKFTKYVFRISNILNIL